MLSKLQPRRLIQVYRVMRATRVSRVSSLRYARPISVCNLHYFNKRFSSESYLIKTNDYTEEKLQRLEDLYEICQRDRGYNYDAFESSAYNYFKELNRRGKYRVVKRLYETYHLEQSHTPFTEKVDEQYRYALENITALNNAAMSAAMDDASYKNKSSSQKTYMIVDFIFNILSVGVILYVGLIFLGSLDFKSPDEMAKFEIKMADDIDTRLDDVKGIEEIKDEIRNLIKMIKDPFKYTEKGAKVHKGVLLFGDPGVGKTLLARAIAGESGVNFIFCTGSTFDEMFVGVGAKRVRQLFQTAREKSPCIIFIDEIDSLLSKSRRFAKEHSSNRSTLNQILAEMDGFNESENIIVIGATNHEGDLDPAAVRPGRFDKKIHVPKPDLDGRKDILKLYLEKVNITDDIEVEKLGKMTPGFSGADLENLVNTAIADAVHKDKTHADMKDFEEAKDRIIMGIERKNLHIGNRIRLNTAIREAGRALTCYYTEGSQKLYKATIVNRGASTGATFTLPDESDMIALSKEKLLAHIDICLGGMAAEEIIFKEFSPDNMNAISTEGGKHLARATNLAKSGVREYGMFGEEGSSFISSSKDDTSDEFTQMVDLKVKEILDESHERVHNLLKTKTKEIELLAKNLFWYDYLTEEEIKKILKGEKLDKYHIREWEDEEEYLFHFSASDENSDPSLSKPATI
ncbi:unnamed protein product [Moneuplotes crassus]|uniref:AAA+ ATPase domain-containing protein n=3 Tax=Euplotes crassus TaxID=5936 RepID=A0AAD1U0Z6_EUPCR|nr:unnamed protein product [Moneuplotes crassus]